MLIDVIVEQSGNHVVCACDGVEVASEVQIDFFHRQHLRVAATCCAALHAEARAERRLAQSHHSLFTNLV